MNAPRLPRESPPSLMVVLVTLFLALVLCFGSVLGMLWVLQWWRGVWS